MKTDHHAERINRMTKAQLLDYIANLKRMIHALQTQLEKLTTKKT
jgi:hypothetical protein